MISTTQTSDERMTHYLRTGRRLHGEAVVHSLNLLGRVLVRSVARLFNHGDRHYRSPA